MSRKPPIVGVIVAGGLSRRMGGGNKGLLPLAGRPMLAHAIGRLAPQVDTVILNANGDLHRFASFGLPVVADPLPGYVGPLAGILAGMRWAESHRPDTRVIATVAADTPFFPRDLVARLAASASGPSTIAVARSAGRVHPVFGVFPVALADSLERFLTTGNSLRVTDWLARHELVPVDFEPKEPEGPDPFFNVNTPADLAEAERRAPDTAD